MFSIICGGCNTLDIQIMNDSSLQAGEREISKDATRSARKQNPLYCSKNRKKDERCDEKLRKKLDWHKQEDSIP